MGGKLCPGTTPLHQAQVHRGAPTGLSSASPHQRGSTSIGGWGHGDWTMETYGADTVLSAQLEVGGKGEASETFP